MKRLFSALILLLLPALAMAQAPGVALDALPTASALTGTELGFFYQAGTGGSGASICARGWCPVSATPLQIGTYVAGIAGTLHIATFTGSITSGHCAQFSNTTGQLSDAGFACGSGGGAGNFQVNGTTLQSSTTVNFINGPSINGLTLTFSNPTAGNVQLGMGGILTTAGGGIGATSFPAAGLPTFSGGITSGHCAQFSTTTGNLVDSGAGCGAGGSNAFSSLTSATNVSATMIVGSGAILGWLGTSTGYTTLASANTGASNFTATLPNNNGTVGELNLAQTWSALQTFGTNISIGGQTATGASGSGNVVFATSPTLTTPTLGAATATTVNGSTVPASAGTLPGSTGAFTSGHCVTIGSTSPLQISDSGSVGCAGSPSLGSNTIYGNAGSGAAALTAPQTIGVINSASPNAQSGASYTLLLADANGEVTMSNASANTLTIPTNASVAFPVGTIVTVLQLGTGTTSIAAAGGVTVQWGGSITFASLGGQYGYEQFQKTATNTWQLISQVVGKTQFTVAGSCNTPASSNGGNTGGTITMAASGTTNSCTLVITPGGALTAGTLWTGRMGDRTQLTVPSWVESASTTNSITFTIPAAIAASDVLSFSIGPQ